MLLICVTALVRGGNAIASSLCMNVHALRKNRPQLFGLAALFLFFVAQLGAFAAEYQGENVDGTRYCAFARSLETGKYYPASVVFKYNHANMRFESGKKLQLTIDKQSIEDPEEVIAIDSGGGWWALSIDGLDEPINDSQKHNFG